MKKKKLYLLIFLLITAFNISKSQVYYKKFYNAYTGASSAGFKVIKLIRENVNNQFEFIGDHNGKELIHVKINNTGDTISAKFYSINSATVTSVYYNIAYSLLSKDYIIVYNDFISTPVNTANLLVLDSIINIKFQNSYHIDGSISTGSSAVNIDMKNNILIGGNTYFSTFPNSLSTLFKTDSVGNLLWNRSYYTQSVMKGFNSICSLNDNSILVSIRSDSLGAVIAKLDSTGNPIWCKSWFRTKGTIEKMFQNPDGTIMMAGHTNFINGAGPVYLLKIDTSGSVIWCKQYGDINQFYGRVSCTLIPTSDSGYMLAANFYHTLTTFNDNSSDILFLKLDQNGDTLWTRTHGSDTYEGIGEIIQTSDGGYFAAGYTMGRVSGGLTDPYGGYYLIRTDSLGFSGCQEWSYPLPVTPIFPTDSNITLTVVQDSVIQDTANIVEVPLGFFKIYDGCLVTNVPEHHVGQNSVQVTPNPTKGIVTITVSEIPKPKDYITVYDSMGKIVLQRPYKQEKQEMDLSHLAKGMYTVKVVQEDKVSVSKVVVE